MLVWVWAALAAGAGAVVASLAFVAVRGLRAWRDLRDGMRAIGVALDDVSVRVERFADRAEAVSAQAGRIGAAVEPLRVSRARLNVLLAAIDEARDTLSAPRALVPRKG